MTRVSKLSVVFVAYVAIGFPPLLFVGAEVFGNSTSLLAETYLFSSAAPIFILPAAILLAGIQSWRKKREIGGKMPLQEPSLAAILEIGTAEIKRGKPIFAFSTTGAMVFSLAIGIFFAFWTVDLLITGWGLAAFPVVIVVASAYDLGNWWRKPVKKARFYNDHFEISGWRVKRNGEYGELERIVKPTPRKLLGEVIGKEKVWFYIKGDRHDFEVPNLKRGVPGVELYQWLRAKNSDSGQVETRRVQTYSGESLISLP